ncbi:MAG TPA: hypothetical protein VKP58_01360 [Candidatus Acidoferrum sp.]|nr:hypothetical protein [Candidatus Acidoferrum sp.]
MSTGKKVLIGVAGLIVVAFVVSYIDVALYSSRVDKQIAAKVAAKAKAEENATWVSADLPSPQIYWADEDTRACANVEFDPKVWKAGVSKVQSGEWTPKMSLRQEDKLSWFSVHCETGDEPFKIAKGTKLFDYNLALKRAVTPDYDDNHKPMGGVTTQSQFTTKDGKTGVKVTRDFNFTEVWDVPEAKKAARGFYYLIPAQTTADDLTKPLYVVVEVAMPSDLAGNLEKTVDEMAASLKFSTQFPWTEAHSEDGYLNDDVKELYGTWDVAACNLEQPAVMRWTLSALDHRHVSVTTQKGEKLKLEIERVGIPGKYQVMLKGNWRDNIHTFTLKEYKYPFHVNYIFKNSPTTMEGDFGTVSVDWDHESRGLLTFQRSNGKPLDGARLCGAK